MESLKEFLCQEGYEKYSDAVKLCEQESQDDPETEPFKSKYKAREIWETLKNKVLHLVSSDSGLESGVAVAILNYRLGTNFIETEELSSGQKLLQECINRVEDWRYVQFFIKIEIICIFETFLLKIVLKTSDSVMSDIHMISGANFMNRL